MKLKTEMRETVHGWHAHGNVVDSNHDLLAAHALMRAIADSFPPSMQMYRNDIMGRSDELMAEWGYTPEQPG